MKTKSGQSPRPDLSTSYSPWFFQSGEQDVKKKFVKHKHSIMSDLPPVVFLGIQFLKTFKVMRMETRLNECAKLFELVRSIPQHVVLSSQNKYYI
jgi:hypothetical protein